MADERDNPGNVTGGGAANAAIHPDAENGGQQVSHDDRNAESGGTKVAGPSEGEKNSTLAPNQQVTLNEQMMFDTLEKYVAAALEDELLAFNSIKIRRTWPKSYEKLVKFMNGKTQMGEMDDETIMGVFMYSPRTVIYNFFDSEKIFVNIFGSDQHWRYTMEANESSEEIFTNRTKCELGAYTEAFNRLEKQLNTKK